MHIMTFVHDHDPVFEGDWEHESLLIAIFSTVSCTYVLFRAQICGDSVPVMFGFIISW